MIRTFFLPRRLAAIFFAITGLLPLSTLAYETDVHFGLTLWLAKQAGYEQWQAEAIAFGNMRVDSGSMTFLEVQLEYACLGNHPEAARAIQQRHYPSATSVPGDPAGRKVQPGSSAARESLVQVVQAAKGKEQSTLGLLGAALHTLQDSWAHAGVPRTPNPGAGVRCSAELAAVPAGEAHDASRTYTSVAATVAMAQATYEQLLAYPAINAQRRNPAAWDTLKKEVEQFAAAKTKTAKRTWFVRQDVSDTAFLEAVSLPNGEDPGSLDFKGRTLPALDKVASSQHGVPQDVLKFFDRLFTRWLGNESIETVLSDVNGTSDGSGPRLSKADARQLTAKLKLWKLKDHGAISQLAHSQARLSERQLQSIEAMSKKAAAFASPQRPEEALFPLVALDTRASPLLPYIVRDMPAESSKPKRVAAIARLKHAPYDTLALVAQQTASGWQLVDIAAVVDQ